MNHRTAQHNFKMAYYRCTGPTTINNRTSWGPMSTPRVDTKYDRPLSGNFDRIINAFERTNAFEYVRNTFETSDKTDFGRMIEKEERFIGHGDIVVNRKMSSSYERADNNLAAQTPCSEEEVAEYYREKILYSQARQLFPLQEDLADWINKTIGISYLNGENFLDVIDNGVELCQLATVIHDKAQELKKEGIIVGKVPKIKGRCWQRAARRSFFSRDNAENFITFCRELGVHENLLFESDDLVLHNQPRQVILCLLELARIATKFDVEPPGLVQLEKEIAMEERDSGLDSAMSGVGWQFREASNLDEQSKVDPPPSPEEINDNVDNESTPSVASNESDVPLKPTNELDKRVQLVTRLMERGCSCGAGKCSKLLKVKKVGEGRYNIAGRNVFIRLLKGRHMMVRVGGGWDTLEHFLSRHEPCQVRLVTPARRHDPLTSPSPRTDIDITKFSPILKSPPSSKASSISGNISPVDSKSSFSGTISPIEKLPSRKSTPTDTKSPNMSPIDRKMNGSMADVHANGITALVKQRNNGLKSPTNRKNSGSISPVSCKSIGSTSSKRSSTASPIDRKTSKGSVVDVSRAPSTSPISKNKSNLKSTVIRKNSGSVSPTSPKVNGAISPLGQRPNSMNSIHRQNGQNSSPSSRANSVSGSLRRTSTPVRPRPNSLNTSTPTGRPMRTPEKPMIKKESRSLSLMSVPKADDKKFCGTDRLNASARNKSTSLASTPTEPKVFMKKFRSHSLASTPTTFCKPISLDLKGMSQADIEESIRISLQNKLLESSTQPFLHIKAKYRSPPPREVPPR